jgi:hypothetical protein
MREIVIPILTGLDYKSLLAQGNQITEENGEFAELAGLLTGETGKRKPKPDRLVEKTGEELFDIMQAAAGALAILVRDYGYSLEAGHRRHINKMKGRGWLKHE